MLKNIKQEVHVKLRWDRIARRYRDSQGRFVSQFTVLRELERFRLGVSAEMRELSTRLQNREVSLVEWSLGMRDLIKKSHIVHAVAALGGLNQLSASELGRIGNRIKQQYRYLNRFIGQIESGEQVLGPGFLARTALYAEAANTTYHAMIGRMMEAAGRTLARRVLGVAEHCPGCLIEAAKGWMPISQVAPIGSQQCRVRCRCSIEYM